MNQLLRTIGGCALAALMFIGCVTNRAPLTEAQKIDRLAATLKIAVSTAVTVAAEDRKQDTRDKIVMARGLVNSVVESGSLEPEAIVQSLSLLWKDAKPEVRLAANTALSLLELYFGDYVLNVPNGNENAVKFLKAVVDGIDQGLSLAPPVKL